jgi:ABC-type phosphate/phosphonate transport system substrate-binding protein
METKLPLTAARGRKTFRTLMAPSRCLSRLGLLLAMVVAVNLGQAFAQQPVRTDGELRVGFTAGVFPDVDQRDAQAAVQLWTRQLAAGMGITSGARAIFFTRTEDMVTAVNRGELSIVTMPALDYLRFRNAAAMSPAIVSQSILGDKRRLILVTRRDSGIKTVKNLRGKSLLLPSRKMNSASHIWIDVLLHREGLPDSMKHFKSVKESSSASQSLMSVFFKQSDAAIIIRGAFETSSTLNPQLASQLTIIAESGALLGDVTCIPNSVSADLRRSIENAAYRLHENTIGKQLCTLFQIDRTIPFQSAYLSGLEELLRERDRMKAGQKKRP